MSRATYDRPKAERSKILALWGNIDSTAGCEGRYIAAVWHCEHCYLDYLRGTITRARFEQTFYFAYRSRPGTGWKCTRCLRPVERFPWGKERQDYEGPPEIVRLREVWG